MAMTELNDLRRRRVAEQVVRARKRKFATKSAAYAAAGVNSATWDRIEEGLPVRDDRLIAVIKTLWPATEGDWTKIPLSINVPVSDAQLIELLSTVSEETLLEELGRRIAKLKQEGAPGDGTTPAQKMSGPGDGAEVHGSPLTRAKLKGSGRRRDDDDE